MPASSTATRMRRQWSVKGFSLEVAVVVAGVGIALLGEYLITEYTWSQRVERTEQEFADDAENIAENAAEMITLSPCIYAQLDALESHLSDPAKRSVPYAGAADSRHTAAVAIPTRPWPNDSWNAALNDGTAARLPRGMRAAMSSVAQATEIAAKSREEREITRGRLDIALLDVERTQETNLRLLQDVQQLRNAVKFEEVFSRQVLVRLSAMEVLPSDASLIEMFEVGASLEVGTLAYCLANNLPIERPDQGWDGLMGRNIEFREVVRSELAED